MRIGAECCVVNIVESFNVRSVIIRKYFGSF